MNKHEQKLLFSVLVNFPNYFKDILMSCFFFSFFLLQSWSRPHLFLVACCTIGNAKMVWKVNIYFNNFFTNRNLYLHLLLFFRLLRFVSISFPLLETEFLLIVLFQSSSNSVILVGEGLWKVPRHAFIFNLKYYILTLCICLSCSKRNRNCSYKPFAAFNGFSFSNCWYLGSPKLP